MGLDLDEPIAASIRETLLQLPDTWLEIPRANMSAAKETAIQRLVSFSAAEMKLSYLITDTLTLNWRRTRLIATGNFVPHAMEWVSAQCPKGWFVPSRVGPHMNPRPGIEIKTESDPVTIRITPFGMQTRRYPAEVWVPNIARQANPGYSIVKDGIEQGTTARPFSGGPPARLVSADIQKFSDAVNNVTCQLTQQLLWARWNGIQNGTSTAQVLAEFREKNSRKLGKTEPERKKKWDTISKRARTVIKPFMPDE